MADAAASGSGLFDTIVKLVNVGFAGVGVVVLLFVFIILMQGKKPPDAGTQQLRHRFLTLGMAFAFFCGVLSVATPLLAPRPVVAGEPAEMLLSFSPRFETEGLPAPSITLPDGQTVPPGRSFVAESGQVLVSVDDALKSVATLKEAALTLAQTASAAQKQADTAVAALAAGHESGAGGAPPPPVASAQAQAEEASRDSQQAAAAISQAIRSGDFRLLETQNRTLNTATRESVAARTRVLDSM